MKKTNLALLIAAGLLAIINLMNGQDMTQDTIFFPNKTVCAIDTKVDGHRIERRDYFPTGELMTIIEYDARTGLQQGDEFWYWRNGEIQHACTFVNGYCHGYAFWWDEVGNYTKTEVYVESKRVPLEEYDRFFPPDEYQDEPDPSAFAARAKGQ